MGRLTESSIINYKNKSHAVTAEVVVPPSGAEGCHRRGRRDHRRLEPLCQGWQAEIPLQLLRCEPVRYRGRDRRSRRAQHQVRMEFNYDGGGLAKGGTVTLYVDGNKVGEGRVDQTEPMVFSADETCDIGFQAGSPSSTDYGRKGQRVQRRGELGGDRSRQGCGESRSPHLARTPPASRHGAAVRHLPDAEPPPAAGRKPFWSVRFLG